MEAILADAQLLLSVASTALQVGMAAEPFVAQAVAVLAGRKTLTAAERADLVAQQEAMSAQLQAADPAV